mmetsp:Transcript_20223/g.51201  ORF Transcript_20223/g.51201 Transcript_20223/m.51201 type:complete len:312 (-) Transcript_20223:1616-2551(-)
MMSMCISLSTTQLRSAFCSFVPLASLPSYTMDPKTMPVSVLETLMLALIVLLSPGCSTCGCGRSHSLRSPTTASSRHRLFMTSSVWLMSSTSSRMSYACTVTYASAYTGSERPVSCVTRLSRDEKSSLTPAPVACVRPPSSSSSSRAIASNSAPRPRSWRTTSRSSACLATSTAPSSLGASAASAACRSDSMAENASRHCARHTCCTSAPELESRCKKVVMRSCESASMDWCAEPALPSCSIPVSSSITCAVTWLATGAATCWRERSASLVSVVATTVARKKSPPTSIVRSLGAPGSAAAPPSSPSAVCVA